MTEHLKKLKEAKDAEQSKMQRLLEKIQVKLQGYSFEKYTADLLVMILKEVFNVRAEAIPVSTRTEYAIVSITKKPE